MKPKITINRNRTANETPTKNIPVGFFHGNIGQYTGLFFRSTYDITFLKSEQRSGKDYYPNWGYVEGQSGCDVTNYVPVSVNIDYQA